MNTVRDSILVVMEDHAQARFFSRAVRPLKQVGITVHGVTARWTIARECRKKGMSVHVVRPVPELPSLIFDDPVSEQYYGLMSREAVYRYAGTFHRMLSELLHSLSVHSVWIWGGGETAGTAGTKYAAAAAQVPVLHWDTGNIPGRVAVDPRGLNFRSSIFQRIDVLDHYHVADDEWENFLRTYPSIRQRIALPRTRRPIAALIDRCHSLVTGVPFRGTVTFLPEQPASDPLPTSFIFLPIPHSFELRKDGQNGEVLNELITAGEEESAAHGLPLVVKLHPLENDRNLIDRAAALRAGKRALLTTESGRELVVRSTTVIGANTSVTLDAMLLQVPVRFTGHSPYRLLTPERLRAFVLRYLLPIDTAGDEEIAMPEVQQALERAEWI